MKLIKSDYKVLDSSDKTMLVKLIVPYYKIMELQLMSNNISFKMLPINNSNEGISFILPEEYNGKSNDLENICNGSDFILEELKKIEEKYLSLIYAEKVKTDRKLILPMCTAYEVLIECKKEMFEKIINSIVEAV